MADGAHPQTTRRRKASQLARKIEFGMNEEIAKTGITLLGFSLLSTAEQRKRINGCLTRQKLAEGELVKSRDILRYWQRRGMAALWAPLLGLRIYQPPVSLAPISLAVIWHRRNDGDAGHAWFRQQIMNAAAGLRFTPQPNR
jgi:hypothetical protein